MDQRAELLARFERVRQASIAMCEGLQPEEYRIQPFTDASPSWWNLGHTSWFYVKNLLEPFDGQRDPLDAELQYLLNSYYVALGERLPRDQRGLMTRPTTNEVYRYRASVDERMMELIQGVPEDRLEEFGYILTIGTHHEQQHQELFYTEIKAILAQNPRPFRRAYRELAPAFSQEVAPGGAEETSFAEGVYAFGNVEGGWCWDNELGVHRAFLHDFALANRLVTNAEYLEFIEDGGYTSQLLWLNNGWNQAQSQGWEAPLYWERVDGEWLVFTLGGMRPLHPQEPVCHVSFYEADAYARWKGQTNRTWEGARLPTEYEWELAARTCNVGDKPANFLDSGFLHPAPGSLEEGPSQMLGDVWEWTSSYYTPYPGFQPFAGALAEYNGKFMDNVRILRGGSCVSERDHLRLSYRNFWPAETQFQFSGFRLARSL